MKKQITSRQKSGVVRKIVQAASIVWNVAYLIKMRKYWLEEKNKIVETVNQSDSFNDVLVRYKFTANPKTGALTTEQYLDVVEVTEQDIMAYVKRAVYMYLIKSINSNNISEYVTLSHEYKQVENGYIIRIHLTPVSYKGYAFTRKYLMRLIPIVWSIYCAIGVGVYLLFQ